jgi:hypothetical protein
MQKTIITEKLTEILPIYLRKVGSGIINEECGHFLCYFPAGIMVLVSKGGNFNWNRNR